MIKSRHIPEVGTYPRIRDYTVFFSLKNTVSRQRNHFIGGGKPNCLTVLRKSKLFELLNFC